MSPIIITLDSGYKYLAGSLLSTVFLTMFQMMNVNKYRRLAKIPYPRVYAEKAEMEGNKIAVQYNCAQRAHANTLESLPNIFALSLITSLSMPRFAAAAVGVWTVGRVLYTIGYTTGDPNKRNTQGGFINMLALLSLVGTASYTVFQLFTSA
ncbi:hypothetical protein BDV98DRAFT_570736 [Pterulicium gracile]|uniref:Membrane-associated proteins in eicosanoid and glutathione metabolism n=1 Tax=Pterulicium gracile TaxID=1884261 RepID=A0A5C3QDF3_9AGAR|nr:hypothetical protein BDV98DRAFT_570736 [Pterula gracilis]